MGGLKKNRNRAAILPNNLLSLQNLLKRDPLSYKEEFLQQHNHYQTTLLIFKQNPTSFNAEFAELISFISQVSSCFPEETKEFPNDLAYLLSKHHNVLDLALREKLVQNLVLLRNKGVITSIALLRIFFPILAVTGSKILRAQIYENIVSLIKAENAKSKNVSLNKMVQSILFEMVQKDESSGVWAIRLAKELWKRNVWSGDARISEICKTAALSMHTKVMLGGVYFFLGLDTDDVEEEDDPNDVDLRKIQHQAGVNKLSKSREKRVQRAKIAARRQENNKKTQAILNFSALQLLHDPQSFSEQLYSLHLASKRPMIFEHKLLVTTLMARVIGTHKSTVLPFYSYLMKWISPHQRDVTKVLTALAGATHEYVPPEIIESCIKKIANEFVTAGVSAEVICVGINTIREMCSRNPLAIEAPLLQDLAEYKGSRDKSVSTAARSIITLYRDVNPELLAKKDRGKESTIGLAAGTKQAIQFGVERGVARGIEGLDLLEDELMTKDDDDEDDGWDGFEVSEDDSSDDGQEWTNVESDGEDLEFTDSEDEQPARVAKPLEASIATTRILTPADFKRLAELKAAAPSKITQHSASLKRAVESGELVDEATIFGPRKKAKQDLEARLATVAEGRKDREKFGSVKSRRGEENRSTTNKEKSKKKNFLMVKRKRDIQGKSMKKLTIKRKELKAHVERGRRGGKRGNK